MVTYHSLPLSMYKKAIEFTLKALNGMAPFLTSVIGCGIIVLPARSLRFESLDPSSYFPYILLNEIQTMFSQLAKRSARVLPADMCTDHAHYVRHHRSTVLRKKQKHGSRRRDCFSLLYFGNSQIY